MKTFFNLIQEVQKQGFCHRCGGCAAFCNALNYGALEISSNGKPRYGEIEKCIECGLCYSICPVINELDEQTRRKASWSEPMGRIIETTVVRSSDENIRQRVIDGGVVTTLLMHLFDRNKIDGAIVARSTGQFQRRPFLATTPEEILQSAGISFDTSQGKDNAGDRYMTYSAIEAFAPMIKKGLKRVAMVGTPCQIKSLRKMQVLNLIPSDSIAICFGLFCSGSFTFGHTEKLQISSLTGVPWGNVTQINIKEDLIIKIDTGESKHIPLDRIDALKRYACHFCEDYSAEFADISFGGLGAKDGWTTIIARTLLGRAVLADGIGNKKIEQFSRRDDSEFASRALKKVAKASEGKKKAALLKRKHLAGQPVQIKS